MPGVLAGNVLYPPGSPSVLESRPVLSSIGKGCGNLPLRSRSEVREEVILRVSTGETGAVREGVRDWECEWDRNRQKKVEYG